MKISIMGGWNTASGASLHCELIGKEFVRAGHELNVFTFYKHAYHGSHITGIDQPYVSRCFTHSRFNPVQLEAKPFIENDYELFIAEDIGMLPKDHLKKIFDTHIRKKAKTISVFHDNQLSNDPSFYQFDWDAIVAFDVRFKKILLNAFPKEKIHIIPYPCTSWKVGDQVSEREKLYLPLDKKIIFCFGDNPVRILKIIEWLNELHEDYPILLLIVTRDLLVVQKYNEIKETVKYEIEIKEEGPSINRLYKYMYAADAMLYYRDQTENVVVASTILQCLGAGCPIVANNSRYTELLEDEIFKYSNKEELVTAFKDIFDNSKRHKTILQNAKQYVELNSVQAVSLKFIQLKKNLE